MKAVILAGGLGSRLKPFTDVIPKPLLPLGEKSLLEVQIQHLKEYGVEDIFLTLGHQSDYIQSFLGDGSRYGVNLIHSVEDIPLGTAGPVKLLQDQLTEPFILMNGDILSKVNFQAIHTFALQHPKSPLTVATKIITAPYRFGNIVSDGPYIIEANEKPDMQFEVIAGIYILKPEIFEFIPENQYYGMDVLIQRLLTDEVKITKYLMSEYWIDIGAVEDYEEARKVYDTHFKDSNT